VVQVKLDGQRALATVGLDALRLTVRGDRISEIDVIADPPRLHQLDVAVLVN